MRIVTLVTMAIPIFASFTNAEVDPLNDSDCIVCKHLIHTLDRTKINQAACKVVTRSGDEPITDASWKLHSAAMLATIVDLDCKLCCCPLTMAEVIATTDTVKIPTAITASRSARPLRGTGCNVNGCIVKVKSNLCEHQSSLDVYIFIYYEMKI